MKRLLLCCVFGLRCGYLISRGAFSPSAQTRSVKIFSFLIKISVFIVDDVLINAVWRANEMLSLAISAFVCFFMMLGNIARASRSGDVFCFHFSRSF